MKSSFSFQGTIARTPYLAASIAVLLGQYLFRGVIFALHEQAIPDIWSFHFWLPVTAARLEGWFNSSLEPERWRLVIVPLIDFALAWLLLALAIRRARTVGRSMLLACLVIVPVIQIPTLLWLGYSANKDAETAAVGRRVSIKVALKGLIAGMVLTVALVAFSALVSRAYGFGLFLAAPSFVGCVTAYIANRQADIGPGSTFELVFGACFLGGVGLLVVAIEGIFCLALAAPIVVFMAWIGGIVGREIALKKPRTPGRMAMSFAIVPLLFAIDLIAPANAAFESVESIEVAASEGQVWDAIVHMGPIPAPPVAPFRWGLAYPMSGTITGSGVGAIREGVFSTGVAYERVTEWEPGRRLSFIVLSDPPTMRELSPYRNVSAPHVSGYFRTLDARFTIVPLADGHSRLSLATRHELDLRPAFYWLPMAKWAVFANKARVLAHFARQAEALAATQARL